MCPDAIGVIINKAGEGRAEHNNHGVSKALVVEKTRLGCEEAAGKAPVLLVKNQHGFLQ